MRPFTNLIASMGDFLMSLSDRARKGIVFGLLLGLGGGGVYKLVVSIENLKKPLPAASPEQLIEPMQVLFRETKSNVNRYQQRRQQDISSLDSLSRRYSTKNRNHQP